MESKAAPATQAITAQDKVSKDEKIPHQMMQFFGYAHLPAGMQVVSKPFGELAALVDNVLPDNPEKSTALRKLLEAKDCAVRATIFKR